MPIYSSSDSEDDRRVQGGKPFGRQRSIHAILGGGKFADVLLWRNKKVSAAILIAVSVIWFLFEVFEYNFVTLLCHIIITTMLVIFIWCLGADIFKWTPPRIPEIILHDSSFRNVTSVIHSKLNHFLSAFFDIACGNNFRQFILALGTLWVLSVIGNYITTLNLLFFGCLCLETLPYLYECYGDEIDHLIAQVQRGTRKSYKKLDTEFLRKIPRGPVKGKKVR